MLDRLRELYHEETVAFPWEEGDLLLLDNMLVAHGRNPFVDDRKLVHLIDPAIKKLFTEKKLMYVRNYGEGVDMSWREAFQTDDRAVVEEYARRSHMQLEWRDGDRLRARSIRQVFATYPKTGQAVWFSDLYEREAVRFDWQEGDVMMVDNFLASHGREPFEGPRKILVAMAELYENTDL